MLLLIACVNVTSLVLVRSENRRREIAVRGALGASPSRLVLQFATEGLLLAAFGSLSGLIFADWLTKILWRLVPKDMAADMPFLGGMGWNTHTIAFAITIALMAAVLFTAAPILRLISQQAGNGLANGGRSSANHLWQRLGARMVAVELAVAVVLLTGAGLLGQSLYRLLHVPLGFDPDHLATAEVEVPAKGAEKISRRWPFTERFCGESQACRAWSPRESAAWFLCTATAPSTGSPFPADHSTANTTPSTSAM